MEELHIRHIYGYNHIKVDLAVLYSMPHNPIIFWHGALSIFAHNYPTFFFFFFLHVHVKGKRMRIKLVISIIKKEGGFKLVISIKEGEERFELVISFI
jgi:hypothetical protein